MVSLAEFFLTLGAIFLLALMTDLIGRKTFLPRVSLLILLGVTIGPSGLDMIPVNGHYWFPAVADMALVMIGFLVGGQLTKEFLKSSGKEVLVISLAMVIVTIVTVMTGLLLLGLPLEAAFLLGAIATSTDPAATVDVVNETKSTGPFTNTLLGIVGVDDLWGIIFFTLTLSLAMAFTHAQGISAIIATGLWDIGGALVLGIVVGLPMACLTGRVRSGEPTQIEALGFVFLCAGLAFWMEVSFLLSSMILGVVVTNLASHHNRPFHAIEGIEWPFLALFFVLSGASLHLETLVSAGHIFILYVLLRLGGRYLGVRLGALGGHSSQPIRQYMWQALLPQAGVALGMALFACQRFPHLQQTIMPVVISGTIIFELVGPIMTKYALARSGEAGLKSEYEQEEG